MHQPRSGAAGGVLTRNGPERPLAIGHFVSSEWLNRESWQIAQIELVSQADNYD